MKIPSFKNLATFVRFRNLWMVSGSEDRDRLMRHTKTVFSSKNKKKAAKLTKKNTNALRTNEAETQVGFAHLRAPWGKSGFQQKGT